jgi:diaminopimelate decarboxylase
MNLNIDALICHVGCGSLDNYGMCKTCDAIRAVLERAKKSEIR